MAHDFGTQTRATLRVVGRRTGQNRWVRAAHSAGSTTLRVVRRVLHILWLEVTGFLFLVLAIIGGAALAREYRHYAAGEIGTGKLLLTTAFTLAFGYFGISSFWRASRK